LYAIPVTGLAARPPPGGGPAQPVDRWPLRQCGHTFRQIKINPKVRRRAADTHPMTTISGIASSVSIPPAQNSGLAALATSSQQLSQAAQQVANPANTNFIDPMVAASQSLFLTQAGAAVISTSNEMMGTLLDVFA